MRLTNCNKVTKTVLCHNKVSEKCVAQLVLQYRMDMIQQGSRLWPKWSHMLPFLRVCELNFYPVAFVRVHDHYSFGNTGTALDIIVAEISPFSSPVQSSSFLHSPLLSAKPPCVHARWCYVHPQHTTYVCGEREKQTGGEGEPTRGAETPGSVNPVVDAGFSHLTSAGSVLLLTYTSDQDEPADFRCISQWLSFPSSSGPSRHTGTSRILVFDGLYNYKS